MFLVLRRDPSTSASGYFFCVLFPLPTFSFFFRFRCSWSFRGYDSAAQNIARDIFAGPML